MVLWGRLLLQLWSIVEVTGTTSLILGITSIQVIEWMENTISPLHHQLNGFPILISLKSLPLSSGIPKVTHLF
ncbi:unnamed protein product [Linum tenue]|uniref:Uncharacterized protein n=1 Tax=Linum tenue TaxID=586396 RepID=A0AAV0H0W3_9ROSI|nr:unnamed protein product [Linum tenue]